MLASTKWHYAGCGLLGISFSAAVNGRPYVGTIIVAVVVAFATASILRALGK